MFVLHGVIKRFPAGFQLGPLSLTIGDGEAVAVVGQSGSGKTTLLNLMAGIIQADAGELRVGGRPAAELRPGRELARLVGLMHQQYDLVNRLSVVHNVLAGRLGEWGLLRSLVSLWFPQELKLAVAALNRVGLLDKLWQRTSYLSGGEQQRVALARLLVQDPRAILADEPVAALDPVLADELLDMLIGMAREGSRTLVVSLHSVQHLNRFHRIVGLRGGQLVFDRPAHVVTADDLEQLYAGPDLPTAPAPTPARVARSADSSGGAAGKTLACRGGDGRCRMEPGGGDAKRPSLAPGR